jgi:hypothetical protein
MNPFEQIDHPLIIIFQVILFVGLVRLFFALHRDPFPLPHIIGLMFFSVLINLTARAKHWEWFYMSDIIQYCLWSCSAWASVFATLARRKKEASQPGAVTPIADFFDRFHIQLTIGLSALAISAGLWAYLDTYSNLQNANADKTIKADSAVVATTQAYQCAQEETSQQQQLLLDSLKRLSEKTNKLLSGQKKDSGQHKTTQHLITEKSAQTRKAVRDAAKDKQQDDNQDSKTTPDDETDKKNLWQRFKGIFKMAVYNRPDSDTLTILQPAIEPDTLLLP